MNDWIKLPPVEGKMACATCGCGAHETLQMSSVLAVGFGETQVTKDGVVMYSEMETSHKPNGQHWIAAEAEALASKDPNHDWRISFDAPLYSATYQRHAERHWVLVEKGDGFA